MDKTEKNIFVAEWHEILNKNVLLSIPNLIRTLNLNNGAAVSKGKM